jgi:hypothetical protein
VVEVLVELVEPVELAVELLLVLPVELVLPL